MRSCSTCQHLKRPDIDRRLAAGEPLTHLAKEYGLSQSSLYRHRANCLKLGSSNAIKKEAARGSAAAVLLPSKEVLTGSYLELRDHIDCIVSQAEHQGSLRIALTGLSSVRQTLDSLARLAAHEQPDAAAKPTHRDQGYVDPQQIAERLIKQFDQEPETKARISAALVGMDEEVASALWSEPNSNAAFAKADPGEQATTGKPASGLPPAVATAIYTANADHAAVPGPSDPGKTVAADGSSPGPGGGSNTASVDANSPADLGNSGATQANVAPPARTNGGAAPATRGGRS
jgi:hypothetical protein